MQVTQPIKIEKNDSNAHQNKTLSAELAHKDNKLEHLQCQLQESQFAHDELKYSSDSLNDQLDNANDKLNDNATLLDIRLKKITKLEEELKSVTSQNAALDKKLNFSHAESARLRKEMRGPKEGATPPITQSFGVSKARPGEKLSPGVKRP